MHFLKQLQTAPLFIKYFFEVVDQHSLQAPFVFQWHIELINAIKSARGIEEIEKVRKSLIRDSSIIPGREYGAGSRMSRRRRMISTIAKYGISSPKDCIFLSELVKMHRPDIVLELGTSLGVATAYLAKSANNTRLYTIEGNTALCERAREILGELKCKNVQLIHGDIDTELPKLLDEINKLDVVIIDANHKGEALLHYYDLVRGKANAESVLVVDDIRWSTDMYRAWKKLVDDKNVSLSIEFLNKGLLFFKKSIRKQHYVLSY